MTPTFAARSLPLPLLVLLAAALMAWLAGCATSPPPGVTPVTPFDPERYQGRWYEIARLDHRFERGLTDVSALYQPKADGSVRVVNRGYDPAKGSNSMRRFAKPSSHERRRWGLIPRP